MKFIFSFLLTTSPLFARDYIVIHFHHNAHEEVKLVQSSLVNQLHFPHDYIKSVEGACEVNTFSLATLCLDESSKLSIAHVNQEVMSKLMNAFAGEKNAE